MSLAVAVAAALLGAAAAAAVAGARARRLAARLTARRLGATAGTAGLPGRGGWAELAAAADALAASHDRRGAALARERPWRLELVDAIVGPALLFDGEGRLQAANAAGWALTGLPRGGVVDAGGGGDAATPGAGATVVQALGSSVLAEAVRRVREDGDPITLDVERGAQELTATVSTVGDETLVVVVDRTRERRVEEVRRNFVVNASHELKTPVTAIQTLAEALEVTLRDDPTRALSLAKRLTGEAERLARLVTDLLDLRRLEEGGPLQRVPVDLAETVRRAVAVALPDAEARRITLDVELPDAAPVAGVRTDVEAVVANLLSNAVKYNRDGGTIGIRLRTQGGARVLTVRDTGIGIPQQDLGRVFERFYRVDAARSRATGGTGLGLSIVRNAVERHGGSVRVESLLGEGTTFTVVLPIEAAP
jgi:signal transduction histidine kinase